MNSGIGFVKDGHIARVTLDNPKALNAINPRMDDTQFFIPEVKAGIIGESGILHRAVRRLPHQIAMGMILTGDRLPAAKAEQYGLVNEVATVDGLTAAADRWADKILAGAPLAVQAAKHAALAGLDKSLGDALSTRYEPIEAYAGTNDQLEGVAAFAEKRKPEWTGR